MITTLEQQQVKRYSRRGFLKWTILGGLVLLTVGQIVFRQRQRKQKQSFTFGFDKSPDDPNWLDDRSFDNVLLRCPESLRFFEPDSCFVFFPTSVCLNFFVRSNLTKNLMVEGNLILNNKETIEGPVMCYNISSVNKPKRASTSLGMVTPIILPTPNEYNIPFPPNFDIAILKRVEWTISAIG